MFQLQVQHAMRACSVSVHPEMSVEAAETLLLRAHAANLYVVDDHHHLLGVVPDYALLKRRAVAATAGTRPEEIGSLMSPVLLSVSRHDSLESALFYLRQHLHPHLPVLDQGKLVGVIDRVTALETLVLLSQQTEELCPVLESPGFSGRPEESLHPNFRNVGDFCRS